MGGQTGIYQEAVLIVIHMQKSGCSALFRAVRPLAVTVALSRMELDKQ
jgi:hypothetical protein